MAGSLTTNKKLTPARISDPFARRTSDSTAVVNSTLVNDTQLFVPGLAANAVYEYFLHAVYNSGATPGFKSDWTLPAGATMPNSSFLCAGSGASIQHGVYAGTLLGGVTGMGADAALDIWGLLVTGVSGGTLQWRWAQNLTNASNTLVKAGSYLRLTRMV